MANDLLKDIPQLVLHFACTIPTRTELKLTEKEALKSLLQEIDQDQFQIFEDPAQRRFSNDPNLFLVSRQYPLESAVVNGPSFIFTPNSISIISIIKLGNNLINSSSQTIQVSELNAKMRSTLFRIQEVVKGLKFIRAGKIYELMVGPIPGSDKEKYLKKILVDPKNDICEVKMLMTRAIPGSSGKLLNLLSNMSFQQMRPEDPFQLAIKVDINNRKHESSLEPRDVDGIWKDADSLIDDHLHGLLY